jgi:outer membrane lipoprotein SlyB
MKTTTSLGVVLASGAVLLAGCAEQPGYQTQSQPYPQQQYGSQQYPSQQYPSSRGYQAQGANTGIVDRIEVINRGDPNNIAGTVIGGIVGGLIGSQIGGGTGNTVATIAGAAGGAYAGNQVQRSRTPQESFRVTVRMDSGGYQTLTEDNISDLRTGDRVRVDGNNVSRY